MAERKRMTAEQVVSYLLEEDGLDFLRESLTWVVQQLMEVEVSELIGAERGERAPEERLTHRNGYRLRPWQTRAGELELAIPKLRRGSYFPSFLEPRRRSEQALVSVVQEAYVAGVSTRKVDQVVESLGPRISKSEVSRICAGLDEQVEAFRGRPLEGAYPYLWPGRHQRHRRQRRIGIVRDRNDDHTQRHEQPRRHLVRRMLKRREQDQDLHVHTERQRLRHRQRAVRP